MMLKIQLWITGINYFLKYIKVEISYFNYDNILEYYCFYCIFIFLILSTPFEH